MFGVAASELVSFSGWSPSYDLVIAHQLKIIAHSVCMLGLQLSSNLTVHMSGGNSVTYHGDTVSAREHD